jgi:enterochelin esterase-like enzyme
MPLQGDEADFPVSSESIPMTYQSRARALSCFLALGAACVAAPAAAQLTVSVGDSLTRALPGQSAESLFVSLEDADYVKLDVTHPQGFTINVVKPDGSLLRTFITPELQGPHSMAFVAEGAGRYAIAVTNTGAARAEYTSLFRERVSLDARTQAVSPRDAVRSPKVEAFRLQLDSGKNTPAIWDAIKKEGIPVVEPFDTLYDLVTFFWRQQGETRNVYLVATFDLPGQPSYALRQLGDSDIWYSTVKLPRGARFRYQLEPNRPSLPGITRVTRQFDALNPGTRWACPPGASKFRCWSVGELPEAVRQEWVGKRTGVAAGRITQDTIHSALQKVDRPITIYTPAGYRSRGKPHSLLVLFDGDDYLNPDWGARDTWDNLIAAGKIRPMVVVMVHNLPGRRLFDLVANPTFGDFMARELVPWIWNHYNVSHEPGETVIGGASAGGLGATYLGLAHPEVFGKVLSMSGAFWWSPEHNGGICAGACSDPAGKPAVSNRDVVTEPNWIAQLALARPPSRAEFYLAAGTFEFDIAGSGGGLLEETRHLRDILRAKNYRVVYQQFVGGHDDLSWRGVMADGLQSLLKISR